MKSLSICLLCAVASLPVDAQSMLKVRLSDNGPITVSVDGRYFNKRGTSVTVGDLPYGNHTLKIFGMSRRYYRGRQVLDQLYSGRVRTYQGMITHFNFDPQSGTIHTEDQDIHREETYRNTERTDTYPDRTTDRSDYTAPTTPVTTDEEQPRTSTSPAASPVSSEGLSTFTDAKMAKLKSKTNAKNNDTEKMNILKDGLKNERLTTYQVSEIMDWLSFENTKVAFAKWAYDKTSDHEYFSDLTQKLSNKAYQDELMEFLKLKK